MDGFAICVIALALGQGEPAAAEKATQPEAAPTSEQSSEATATPTAAPRPTPTPGTTPVPPSTSTSTPSSATTPTTARNPTAAPVREPAAAPSARPPRRAAAQSSQPRPASTAAGADAAAPAKPPAASPPAPTPRAADVVAGQRAEPEREQALRAARSFLEALAASDPDALAQAASDRFSFDGEAQSGREDVRRKWRALLAGRPGPSPRVNGVEVLAAQDAIARWGNPPARIAALARPGVWVAVGDVGGRPVVLFLSREGGRIAVLGIHD